MGYNEDHDPDSDADPAKVDMRLDQYRGNGFAEAPDPVQEAVRIRRRAGTGRNEYSPMPADRQQGGGCQSAFSENHESFPHHEVQLAAPYPHAL